MAPEVSQSHYQRAGSSPSSYSQALLYSPLACLTAAIRSGCSFAYLLGTPLAPTVLHMALQTQH